jgi:serine/threonine protein kinase
LVGEVPSLFEGGWGVVYPAGPFHVLKVPHLGAHLAGATCHEVEVLDALPPHSNIIAKPWVARRCGWPTQALVYPRYAGDLVTLHGRSGMTRGILRGVGRQVAAALAHAHAHGWAHCDVKLDNILGDGAGTYVLADWGAAKALSPTGSTAQAQAVPHVHTPMYTAPELLARPWSSCDLAKCDMYALGVTLLGLARMKPVSPDWRTHQSQARAVRDGPLRDLLTALLEVDPSGRPSARDLLAHPFLRLA